MPIKILTDLNPDGALIGQTPAERIGFYGAVPTAQRSNPMQQIIQGGDGGALMIWGSNQCPLANVAASTAAEQANLTLEGLLTTDFLLCASRANAPAAGLAGIRISAANTVALNFLNPTAANANLTANEIQMTVAVARGLNVITQNFGTISNVAANNTMEQVFTVGGANAAATAYYSNTTGQLTGINVTNGGSGYYVPPTVVITPAANSTYGGIQANQNPILTGTMQPLPVATGGSGATAQAVIANGAVVSVIITDPGSGYTAAPTISFVASSYVSPGMIAAVNMTGANTQAGLGIVNVRIPAKNQIAVTWANPSAANIAPTANANYYVAAFNEMVPSAPHFYCRANLANFTATAANAAGNTTPVTIPGLLATDYPGVTTSLTILAAANVGSFNAGNCTANTLNLSYTGGVAAWTPANGTYVTPITRTGAYAPMVIWQQLVTPTAVATLTANEQSVTVQTGILPAWANNVTTPIYASKPSHTAGIGIGNVRCVNSTSIGITFLNVSTSNVTPPAEIYTFAAFPVPLAAANANLITNVMQYPVSLCYNQMVDLINEVQATMAMMGQIKGA